MFIYNLSGDLEIVSITRTNPKAGHKGLDDSLVGKHRSCFKLYSLCPKGTGIYWDVDLSKKVGTKS